jgi:hypothetical protein
MTDLVLDSKQSTIVAKATGQVRILDDRCRELGTLAPIREEDVAPLSTTPEEAMELKRRMTLPIENLPTTQQVLARLKQRVTQ